MTELTLNIGAQVYCTDGKGGKLVKIVVDPHTRRITDLIVEKGFLQKKDRVLPISLVHKTTEEAIYLNIPSTELTNYPEFREIEFTAPATDWKPFRHYPNQNILHWATPYGFTAFPEPSVPKVHHHILTGIDQNKTPVGRGTPIYTLSGMLARVDHVLVNPDTDEITHLVANKGVFPYQVIIPITLVDRITADGIYINKTTDELKGLARYTARLPVDILEDLKQRLAAALPDFRHVRLQLDKGVLSLHGFVKDEAAREEAETIARAVPGVLKVENYLDTHLLIETQIYEALAQNPLTRNAVLEVHFDRGIVTLQGEVDSYEVKRQAEIVAGKHPKVIGVINEVTVRHGEPDLTVTIGSKQ
ncbi:MAG: BON domain-containing protein [Chloroflexi bacterium]|nr:MAG: BON domain-containing protein [Chloroflexota bacterium]